MGAELHVMPNGDAVEHETDFECVCGPALDVFPDGVMLTHHSLDGRESRG